MFNLKDLLQGKNRMRDKTRKMTYLKKAFLYLDENLAMEIDTVFC
jgi:hypothetical protein